MKWRCSSVLCALAVVLPISAPSCIGTKRVASGLDTPVFATAAPGENNKLYVLEQQGRIRTVNTSTGAIATFLDIRSLVKYGGEQGLVGLAFSPAQDGKFYVYYTSKPNGETTVVEYARMTSNPDVADPASARIILTYPQPQANHNGGWMGFGLDNFLYIALGDGGGGNDDDAGHTPDIGNAQDIDNNLLGKILRINPFGGDDFPSDSTKNYTIPGTNPFVGVAGDDEIWAYGLRNPFRCSFDRQTHDFWIGDVGQDSREEIDFQAQGFAGGANYGWRLREGTIATPGVGGPPPADNVEPIYDYPHGSGQFQGDSVIGGYVYRGPIAELNGKYFFADYVNNKVWSITRDGTTYDELTDWTTKFKPDVGSINGVSSFGEDNQGNVYIVDLDGEIFQIVKKNPFAQAASAVSRTVGKVFGTR